MRDQCRAMKLLLQVGTGVRIEFRAQRDLKDF
jgi:hypothetical protein